MTHENSFERATSPSEYQRAALPRGGFDVWQNPVLTKSPKRTVPVLKSSNWGVVVYLRCPVRQAVAEDRVLVCGPTEGRF